MEDLLSGSLRVVWFVINLSNWDSTMAAVDRAAVLKYSRPKFHDSPCASSGSVPGDLPSQLFLVLLFPDIFIPYFWFCFNEFCHEIFALYRIQVGDLNATRDEDVFTTL